MRNARVWQAVLGLTRAVIEAVVFDEGIGAVVAEVRPRKGASSGAVVAGGGLGGMTVARVVADGEHSMWAR